jgi:hypothetical protein
VLVEAGDVGPLVHRAIVAGEGRQRRQRLDDRGAGRLDAPVAEGGAGEGAVSLAQGPGSAMIRSSANTTTGGDEST